MWSVSQAPTAANTPSAQARKTNLAIISNALFMCRPPLLRSPYGLAVLQLSIDNPDAAVAKLSDEPGPGDDILAHAPVPLELFSFSQADTPPQV